MHTFRTTPLEVKYLPDDAATGSFTGLASAFRDRPDHHGDIVVPGAFKRTLAQHSLEGTRPAMLWSHDQSKPIGAWQRFKETSEGLEVTGQLALDVPEAKSAHGLMQQGALALSIGYRIAKGGAEIRASDGVRLLKDVDLFEVSLVAMPSDNQARITAAKGLDIDIENPREFERAARDALGLSSREAKRLMSEGYKGLVRDERDSSEELAAIAAKLQRINNEMRS